MSPRTPRDAPACPSGAPLCCVREAMSSEDPSWGARGSWPRKGPSCSTDRGPEGPVRGGSPSGQGGRQATQDTWGEASIGPLRLPGSHAVSVRKACCQDSVGRALTRLGVSQPHKGI